MHTPNAKNIKEPPVGRVLTQQEINALPVGVVTMDKVAALFEEIDDNTVATVITHKRAASPIIYLMAVPCTLVGRIQDALKLLGVAEKTVAVEAKDFSDFEQLEVLTAQIKETP